MERYGENNSAAIKPSSIQGFAMVGGKFTSEIRNNRRPLRDIKNFVNAPLPRAVIKGKPAAEDKSRNFEGHRPMTRKLAASLANKKLSHQDSNQRNGLLDNENCKKAIPNSNDLESITVIDVDEYMEASEPPLPALENQTEAILEEMESMVGVTNHPSNKENAWLPSFISKRLSSVSGDPDEAPGGPTMIGHPRATLWLDPDHSSPAAHHGVRQKIFQSADRIIQQQDCNPEEVEMEDLEEPVPDIDSCDRNNQLAVVDYVEDIYAFYRQAENSSCVCPNYMSQQSDINEKMRAILIDWLIEVHYKFELMAETLFLTVNLIDRFLEHQTVVRKKLQLVGVTAMLLACKYEEVSIPVVEDLITISDRAYTRDEVLAMEKLMINTLQFNMSVPTPYVFMRRFLKAAQSDKTLELLSFFMIELCLVEYEMLKFRPSLLAAAAIYTSQCTLKGFKHWSTTSEWHTRYTEDQLQECSRLMVDFHQNAAAGRLTGVHRKYSTSKFGFAAKSEPACFLLDTRL